MRGVNKEPLGSLPISKLLIQQSIPASIGILVMSLNILIDTVFVGQWIGSEAIAAINVVLPVSFFIAALGMSIGVGGGSIISRSLGEKNITKAEQTFGNQITLTLILTVLILSPVFVIAALLDQFLFNLMPTAWFKKGAHCMLVISDITLLVYWMVDVFELKMV